MSDAQISGAPGAESPVAGRQDDDASVAGAAPDGGALDRTAATGEDGLNDAGESMADDAVPPAEGTPSGGDPLTGDSAAGGGPTP